MRTTTIRQLLPLVGMGLMLAGLFGGPASAEGLAPFAYQNDWGIRILGDSKIIGGSATAGGSRTVGDTGMIGRPEDQGMACPIAIPFRKARSARCSARASGAAAGINAANTGANRQGGEPG
jgi:hypothetical protein